ncbi:MAG: S49 family peptidase, partial [Balneolales bacterium]
MYKPAAALLFILIAAGSVWAQDGFRSWHERTEFLMATPGSMKYGLYGFDNPALAAFVESPDILFQWSDDDGFTAFNHWGLFAAVPGLGFGALNDDSGFTDYRISTAFGNEAGSVGLAYGWYGGDTGELRLDQTLTLGTIMRPNRYISIGLTGTTSLERKAREGVAELAVRPFGTPNLALFGDYALRRRQPVLEGRWSAGAAFEGPDGLRFTGRYIDDIGFTAGIQLSFGRAGISAQRHLDMGGESRYSTYSLRLGAYDRNFVDSYLRSNDSYLKTDLQRPVSYQSRRFFDRSQSFEDILSGIREAQADQAVAGIVVNTTGMSLNQAMMWEIRDELSHFQAAGKQVVVYIERGGMMTLHLASVADRVVMDPRGGLTIPGYSSGTTYLAEALDAIGIGVDEFREMEYKSALEPLSRSQMSQADREQREDIVDRFYELTRKEVTQSRNIDPETYDDVIDRGISLTAGDLVEAGIVDTLVRFSDIDELVHDLEGKKMGTVTRQGLLVNKKPGDEYWGLKPQVAILYAIGPTMTDSGIRGRVLAEEIRKARKSDRIRAVVLRADSPGGDDLASDLVAEEIRKTTEVKPVIVSMGSVAASGGYWISMYADSILVTPNTLTGSIGVAGSWFYDKGLSENLRLNYDHVSRGESADLIGGRPLPLLGLSLPGRELTDREREGLVRRMQTLYDVFIDKVAEGRNMDSEEVKAIAEGRIWTGEQAVQNGL